MFKARMNGKHQAPSSHNAILFFLLLLISHHVACIYLVSPELSNLSCSFTEVSYAYGKKMSKTISSYMLIKTCVDVHFVKHLFEVLRMVCLYRLPPQTIKFNVEVFLLCHKLILK